MQECALPFIFIVKRFKKVDKTKQIKILESKISELKELIQAIIINRSKCFIPESGNPEKLYEWTERAKESMRKMN